MLVSALPFLIDMGLYTPQVNETWFQWCTSYLFLGYNYCFDIVNVTYVYSSNIINIIYNKTCYWLYYPIRIPYYLIVFPFHVFMEAVSFWSNVVIWCWGVLTIFLGVKLWVLWQVIVDEANTIIINMNLVNPIPAYIMAIFYHILIRPGQLVVSNGATFFIDYFRLILPSWDECYDLLRWVVTGRASMIWNNWLQLGNFVAQMRIYPIALAGVIVDPLQVVLWFHFSLFDHGILRPSLFLGTIFATGMGRLLGIFI